MNFNVAPPEAEHRSHPAVVRRARRLDEAARRGPPRRVQDLGCLCENSRLEVGRGLFSVYISLPSSQLNYLPTD